MTEHTIALVDKPERCRFCGPTMDGVHASTCPYAKRETPAQQRKNAALVRRLAKQARAEKGAK